MKAKPILAIVLLLAGALVILSGSPAAASTDPQAAIPSPTPGPDGRIIYYVKAGDNCTQLSLLYGVSVDYIRSTNLLDADCTLHEGQPIMLGVGGPSSASPTPGPSLTPATPMPSPTPGVGGSAEVCILVYNDANGDALRQESEGAIPGAAISLTSEDGTYSQNLTSVINPDTTAYQGTCFTDVPAGKYNVSAAAPDGFKPTINLTSSVELTPGDVAYVDFGAQSAAVAEPDTPAKGPSPLLGVIGAALLLGGIGLGIYSWRMLRGK
jgi:hypothetical protein